LSQPEEIRTTGNHFSSFGHTWFQKNYTCWNKHGEEGLNELEAGCLNEVKCETMLPNMTETLMTVDFLRKMNPYSNQM
jgi:hypothetical protein